MVSFKLLSSPGLVIMGSLSSSVSALSNFLGQGFARKGASNGGSHAIQRIFDDLSSIVDISASVKDPSSCPQIGLCMEAMNEVTLECLGLDEDTIDRMCDPQCYTVYCNDKFHIAAFFIPAGRGLPLHDHPSMAVLSKVICGAMNVKSFTPSAEDAPLLTDINSLKRIPVKTFHSVTRTPLDKTWFLSPSEGNVHEFTAESPCVVFDVLMPPYEEPERPCNYYESLQDADGGWWLQPAPEPADLPYSVHYNGIRPVADRRARLFKEI